MNITDVVTIIAATATEAIERLGKLGDDHGTGGPEPHADVIDIVPPPHPCWQNGWWVHATQRPAHPGRIGGPISPFVIVDHATSMLEDEFDALVHAMTTRRGAGNGFHFLIGRNEKQGVVQCTPIDRNGNHAGGPEHGVFVDSKGRTYHPNLVSIGIELHCAGDVRQLEGQWRLVEAGKAHGKAIPPEQVIPDPKRPGRGWHQMTPYQYERLTALHHDIELVMAPMPPGLVGRSSFEPAQAWAQMPAGSRAVGHVTLDPRNRTDPHPPTMDWLRALR
jgi:hypothetical protein